MNDFFLELYNDFQKMGMNCKDLDHMLDALPWEETEHKPDGTVVYICKIKRGEKDE
jgi:hypothetical protein